MSSCLGKRQVGIMLIHGVQRPTVFSAEVSQDDVNITKKDLGFRDEDDVRFVKFSEVFEVECIPSEALQVPGHSCER